MRKEKLISRLINLECYRTKDRQLWELDELELTVLLAVTIIKQLKGIGIMKLEIKCSCGMNVSASLNEVELENEHTSKMVLPIIATEDNGIDGILVNTEEKAILVKCTNCDKSVSFLLEPELIAEDAAAEPVDLEWSQWLEVPSTEKSKEEK
ncbi:hypothetical protein EVG22_23515 [Bacillus thuringiensis serovar andalousiensis]|uniref:Uncharacterized protein n=2 Tax=Bacillus TaxID=1386 RepID=A0A6H0TJV9_BACTU|nr:hypothetical protein EVG22_23515 [Bacillus thuringiensis serovar andalousiensis]